MCFCFYAASAITKKLYFRLRISTGFSGSNEFIRTRGAEKKDVLLLAVAMVTGAFPELINDLVDASVLDCIK